MRAEGVPDELVEKAARAQYENRVIELDQDGDTDWDALPESWREEWREGARHALAAVLPDIQAQALREAADAVPVDLWATFGRADRRVVEGFKEWLYSKAVQRSARLTTTTEETK